MQENYSRKIFLKKCAGTFGCFLGGALLLSSCNSGADKEKETENKPATGTDNSQPIPEPANCNDVTGLSKEEIEKRKSLGYVEEAPSPDVRCDNCKLYLPPAEGKKCGSCSLFKGYVDVAASCTYFAPLNS